MIGPSASKKVLVVLEGTWGDVSSASAKNYIATCVVEPLQRAKRIGRDIDEEIAAADIKVVDTLAQSKEFLAHDDVDVVVFNSHSQIAAVRELKKQFPSVQMIVLTGLIPKDEVLIVSKDWFVGDSLVKAILYTPQG